MPQRGVVQLQLALDKLHSLPSFGVFVQQVLKLLFLKRLANLNVLHTKSSLLPLSLSSKQLPLTGLTFPGQFIFPVAGVLDVPPDVNELVIAVLEPVLDGSLGLLALLPGLPLGLQLPHQQAVLLLQDVQTPALVRPVLGLGPRQVREQPLC